MEKTLSLVAAALAATVLILDAPAQAQYPPTPPRGDCAVTGIASGPWTVNAYNSVIVTFENHGTTDATCRVSLTARTANGRRAIVRRRSRPIDVAQGQSMDTEFLVRPPVAGTYTLVACAESISPPENHSADDCMGATVGATSTTTSRRSARTSGQRYRGPQ